MSSWCPQHINYHGLSSRLICEICVSISWRNSNSLSNGSSFTYATLRLNASTCAIRVPGRDYPGAIRRNARLDYIPLKQIIRYLTDLYSFHVRKTSRCISVDGVVF